MLIFIFHCLVTHINFSIYNFCVCACARLVVQLPPTFCNPYGLWPGQALLFMEFFRQEYWSGLPFPTLGELPDPGIKLASLASPALVRGIFTTVPPGRLMKKIYYSCKCFQYLFSHFMVRFSFYQIIIIYAIQDYSETLLFGNSILVSDCSINILLPFYKLPSFKVISGLRGGLNNTKDLGICNITFFSLVFTDPIRSHLLLLIPSSFNFTNIGLHGLCVLQANSSFQGLYIC